MYRRPVVICVLLGAVATSLTAGIVSAQGGSGRQALRSWGFGAGAAAPMPHITQSRTLRLRAHDFVAAPLDNDPAGTSQGDAITVNGLISRRHGDANIGRLDVNEVFTDLQPNGSVVLLINVTATLPEGQISATGVGRISHTGAVSIRLPVTGGTGKYRNARGTLVAVTHGASTRLAYQLIP